MITKYELRLAQKAPPRGAVSDELEAQVKRLEAGLYALREGVHGFLKAKESGIPLEGFEGHVKSLAGVARQAEKLLLDAIVKLETFSEKGRQA
jgi:hypothetical protein